MELLFPKIVVLGHTYKISMQILYFEPQRNVRKAERCRTWPEIILVCCKIELVLVSADDKSNKFAMQTPNYLHIVPL